MQWRRPRRLIAALALALTVAIAAPIARSATDDDFEQATSMILCDCGCHPQSVKECACGRAAEMRGDIAAMVDRGMDGDAIIADYVAKHGEQIRIAPTASGFNLLAWLGPLVLLVGATLAVMMLVRRWAGHREAAGAGGPADTTVATGTVDQDRLKRAMEEW